MMIELDKCVGCQACVTSCKQHWGTGPGAVRDWVYEYEHGTRDGEIGFTFYPGLCMQCAEHPCTEDCPTGATYMDERTGVVMVDRDLCIGCGNCISRCAYGARTRDREQGIIEKCNLCAPYVERGEEPACVATCLAECRHFGDLDDPDGELVRLIRERGAKPLTTAEVDIGPKVVFAGDAQREKVLAGGVVTPPVRSTLTSLWTGWTRPFAGVFAPFVAGVTVAGGLMLNLRTRKERAAAEKAASSAREETLPRHRAGLRFLHWLNALSWVVLLFSGVGLMSAESFALFGEGFPRWAAGLMGGASSLLRFHVVWGLAWAAIIIPVFLVYKRGGFEALAELKLTWDDLRWLKTKPLAMVGRLKTALPDQDKYNAGQKLFAMAALVGTAVIVATGVVMVGSWGSAALVSACILVHKLAVAVTFIGVAVHVTMAGILAEERPALVSMITGRISREHAAHHNAKWVRELEPRPEEER
jgi:formate dehydrogenase gamma subunit